MLKKTIISTLCLITVLLVPASVLAQEQEITCTSVYEGGVVCGVKTHEPIETAIGDLNPAVFGAGLVLTSGIFYYFSRKAKNRPSLN